MPQTAISPPGVCHLDKFTSNRSLPRSTVGPKLTLPTCARITVEVGALIEKRVLQAQKPFTSYSQRTLEPASPMDTDAQLFSAPSLLDLSRIGLVEASVDSAWAHLEMILDRQHVVEIVPADQKDGSKDNKTLAALRALSVSHNNLGDNGVVRLVRLALSPSHSKFLSISCLDLFCVGLTDGGISKLIALLEGQESRITRLKLGDNLITGAGLCFIAESLHRSLRSLCQLHIGGNPITAPGVVALAKAYTTAPHNLQILGLRDLQKSSADGDAEVLLGFAFELLLAALAQPRVVHHQGSDFNAQLSDCRGLVELQLRGTMLTNVAVRNLAHGFQSCCGPNALVPFENLEALDLTSCGLCEDSAAFLLGQIYFDTGRARCKPLRLRELFLQGNRVGFASCVLLGKILGGGSYPVLAKQIVCPLATLEMSNNELSSADICAFFLSWADGAGDCCLNALHLSGNVLGADAVDALVRILKLQHDNAAPVLRHTADVPRRVLLTSLTLQSCSIDAHAAERLFAGITTFPGRFRVLEMPQNRCGNASVPSLCGLLQQNTSLSKLFLQDNHITSLEAMHLVVAALETNTTLRCVSFGGQSEHANNVSIDMRKRIMLVSERNKKSYIAQRNQQNRSRHRQCEMCVDEESTIGFPNVELTTAGRGDTQLPPAVYPPSFFTSPWDLPHVFSVAFS
jgi:hypothetical protein